MKKIYSRHEWALNDNHRYSSVDKSKVRIIALLFYLGINIANAKEIKIQY